MKNARVILPKADNKGNSLQATIDNTALQLCQEFGGATLIDATGYWMSPEQKLYNEPVVILESAMSPDAQNRKALQEIGKGLLALTDQEAIYIQYADGEVEILEGG